MYVRNTEFDIRGAQTRARKLMLHLNKQEQDNPHVINTPEDKRWNNYKGLLSRTHINQNSVTGEIESLRTDPIKWDETNYILTTKNRNEPSSGGPVKPLKYASQNIKSKLFSILNWCWSTYTRRIPLYVKFETK